MTHDQQEQIYLVLRGTSGRSGDKNAEALWDVMAMEELEQLRPILWDIEAQAEARARFKHLLELAWALKQASSSYAEVTHDFGCGKSKERGLLAK